MNQTNQTVMKTVYECSKGKAVKWITGIVVFILLFVVLKWISIINKGDDITWPLIGMAFLLAIPIGCYLVTPLYILATEEGIGIRTPLRTRWIPYECIDHIERIDEKSRLYNNQTLHVISAGTKRKNGFFSASGTVRLFGIGGVFGFIGWFRTKGIGTFYSYVTNPDKAFLIYRTKGLPIAISVDEPDEFMPFYMKGGTI